MYLTQWNPFAGSYGLAKRCHSPSFEEEGFLPAVNVTETEKEYKIAVELPGVKKEDVKVSFENGALTVSGERRHEEKNEKVHFYEISYGSFRRSFELPNGVDADKIGASFKDGVLNVTVQKGETMKPKQIDLK